SENGVIALETLLVAVGVLATLNLDLVTTEVAPRFLDCAAKGDVNKSLNTRLPR
ncbi:hypothetical protein Tco_0043912, partial [Tanacetum coccineum]